MALPVSVAFWNQVGEANSSAGVSEGKVVAQRYFSEAHGDTHVYPNMYTKHMCSTVPAPTQHPPKEFQLAWTFSAPRVFRQSQAV